MSHDHPKELGDDVYGDFLAREESSRRREIALTTSDRMLHIPSAGLYRHGQCEECGVNTQFRSEIEECAARLRARIDADTKRRTKVLAYLDAEAALGNRIAGDLAHVLRGG